jgi:hypothetical protein
MHVHIVLSWPVLAAGLFVLLAVLTLRRRRKQVQPSTIPVTPSAPGEGWQESYIGGSQEAEQAFIAEAVSKI